MAKKSKKSRSSRKSSQGLAAMSVDALFNLRDEVAAILSSKAAELQRQLARLGGVMEQVTASAVVARPASVVRSRVERLPLSFVARRTPSSRGAGGVRWLGG